MRKIAIVAGSEIDDDYNSHFIAQHITEWTEVTDKELESAMEGLRTVNGIHYGRYGEAKYRIIEFPAQGPVLSELIEAGRVVVEKREEDKRRRDEKQAEINKQREATRKKNAEARELKTKEDKLKKLRELSAELGIEIKSAV